MNENALRALSAAELAGRLQQRTITAEAVVRAFQNRIAEREPEVQAWTALAGAKAIAYAQVLDRGPITGPLHGLPLGVKDLFDTADLPASYGSPIYADNQPASDAAPVALARAAGAVVMGKTVTTEFATYQAGPTHNPHHLDHTPGGSSSGSAAAVADRMVPLAFGTQTAGSIIRPASYCGVVGFKPSFGYLTRAGVKSLAETLDTVGGFGSSVEDVGLLMGALSGDPRLGARTLDGSPRIGFYFDESWDQTLPETRAAVEQAQKVLALAGARVSDVKAPAACVGLAQAHVDVMAYEASRALAYEWGAHRGQLSAGLVQMLEVGSAMTYEQYRDRKDTAALGGRAMQAVFKDYDLLLAPSAAGVAPLKVQGTGDPLFCRSWSLLGLPCVHLPFATGPVGLPVGLQAVGAWGDDGRTLGFARWVLGRLLG